MTWFKKIFVPIAVATAALPAAAEAAVTCSFNLNTVWLQTDSWVSVSATTGNSTYYFYVCPASGSFSAYDGSTWNTVTSDTCKAIFSHLLALRASNRPWTLYFSNQSSCSGLTFQWSQPYPYPSSFIF
jgi:hypothetical protein